MSKFSKFYKNPKLFFIDMVRKRRPNERRTERKTAKNEGNNLIISNINPFEDYNFYYHCGESLASGTHHLDSWLPIFTFYATKCDVKYILIIRNKQLFDWTLNHYPYVNVALARRAVDVESILKTYPNITLALYSSAGINNGHLIRFNNVKHVFIGHGDSEKAGSAHKGLRWFDEIWTSGQAHIDRFNNLQEVNFRGLDFVKVGRPSLKKLLSSASIRTSQNIMQLNILYLPTWEGVFDAHQYFSIPISTDIIKLVSSEINLSLSVKFHPYTGGREPIYKNIITSIEKNKNLINNFSIVVEGTNIVDIIENFDIFICDISSVVTECLSLNKPIFLYKPKDKEIDIAQSNMSFEQYCYVFSSLDELREKLNQVISGDDYLQEDRKVAMNYFIGVQETLNDKMLELIKNH